jgi:DNA-directed RNA polymerase subunit M/transcription elongation factor TFIIS
MKITAKCDKCNSSFSVDEKFTGRKAKCAKCGESFIVQAAKDAISPEKQGKSAPAAKESPPAAAGDENFYSLSAPEAPRCPNCQKTIQPKDILCVNCGYDLLTHTQSQFQKKDTDETFSGGTAIPLKRRSYEKSEGKTKRKSKKKFPVEKVVKASVIMGVILGSIACIWGAMVLYRNATAKWDQVQAFGRLDTIFYEDHVSQKGLAQDLPYIFAFVQKLPERQPKYAEVQVDKFLEAIPKIPKETDLTPLLEFPPDSPAYLPILNLLDQRSELAWRMQKSCDPSETARHYGADLLMARLPFVTWTEADKISLRERTDIAEKERRFRKYADQSQAAAEKMLVGRYYLEMEAPFSDLAKAKLVLQNVKATTAKTPDPVLEAASKNKTWTVSFFGRTWSGPIEQFSQIDLACQVMEHGDYYKDLPFFEQLQEAVMHLRFKGNAFEIEMEKLPIFEYLPEWRQRIVRLSTFNGFQCALIKATQ